MVHIHQSFTHVTDFIISMNKTPPGLIRCTLDSYTIAIMDEETLNRNLFLVNDIR